MLESRNLTDEFEAYDIESFHAFVQYLIARGPEAAAGGHYGVRVRHWTRFYDICHFCAIDWDFIGKVESIYEGLKNNFIISYYHIIVYYIIFD